MRLSEKQILTIKNIIRDNFGEDAKLILFGSRLDDAGRGGDIDLLVLADFAEEELFLRKLKTLGQLQRALGDQKIDLLTAVPAAESPAEVVKIALKEGVFL